MQVSGGVGCAEIVENILGFKHSLLRVGVGYEFHLQGHWTLSPEIIGDFIEGGAQTWLAGAAIGYEF